MGTIDEKRWWKRVAEKDFLGNILVVRLDVHLNQAVLLKNLFP